MFTITQKNFIKHILELKKIGNRNCCTDSKVKLLFINNLGDEKVVAIKK